MRQAAPQTFVLGEDILLAAALYITGAATKALWSVVNAPEVLEGGRQQCVGVDSSVADILQLFPNSGSCLR